MIRNKSENPEIIIDLTGPDGNAFSLIGYANKFAKQLRFEEVKITKLNEELTSGDYENLVSVFDTYFGHFVILER